MSTSSHLPGLKRPYDGSPSESESHGEKKLESSFARLSSLAGSLLIALTRLRPQIIAMSMGDEKDDMVAIFNHYHEHLNLVQWESPAPSLDFSLRFPTVDNTTLALGIVRVNAQLDAIQRLWDTINESGDSAPPRFPPHDFARDCSWKSDHSNLCSGRPCEGSILLPLSACHPVFGRFLTRIASQQPPTPDDVGYEGYAAAEALVQRMGNCFDSEETRGELFTTLLSPCFPERLGSWKARVYAHGFQKRTFADWAFFSHGDKKLRLPLILREDKKEPGDNGDAYMQLCRSYQIWVGGIQDASKAGDDHATALLEAGCPVFLLSLVGPELSVHGGFYTGKTYLVEPLSPTHWMLDDRMATVTREYAVAQVLHALVDGVKEIQQPLRGDKPPRLEMLRRDIPTIYETCKPFGRPGSEGRQDTLLTLISRIPSFAEKRRPAFEAAWVDPSTEETQKVFVKLTSQQYGTTAHQRLASEGFAPTLLAISEREGAPTGYIMEWLAPDHWVSLDKLQVHQHWSSSKTVIRTALLEILDALERECLVHGNLYPNNIMVKVQGDDQTPCTDRGRAVLKLIGWDWSGKANDVFYPHGRERVHGDLDGLVWPITRGKIHPHDDRRFFERWFECL